VDFGERAIDSAEISSVGLTLQKHYPLRGLPLAIADDFVRKGDRT
jgi:hypothetical protein